MLPFMCLLLSVPCSPTVCVFGFEFCILPFDLNFAFDLNFVLFGLCFVLRFLVATLPCFHLLLCLLPPFCLLLFFVFSFKIKLAFCFPISLPLVCNCIWVHLPLSIVSPLKPRPDRMTGPSKMDPAVNGRAIISWYRDFMTNPASRARQIAASNLFFQAHASATAKLPAQAHASAPTQLPAHASVPTLDKPSVSPFCGTRLAYKVPPPRKQCSRLCSCSLKSGSGAPAPLSVA